MIYPHWLQTQQKKWQVYSKNSAYIVGQTYPLYTSSDGDILSIKHAYWNNITDYSFIKWILLLGAFINICIGLYRYITFRNSEIVKAKIIQIRLNNNLIFQKQYITLTPLFTKQICTISFLSDNPYYQGSSILFLHHKYDPQKSIAFDGLPKYVRLYLFEERKIQSILKRKKKK